MKAAADVGRAARIKDSSLVRDHGDEGFADKVKVQVDFPTKVPDTFASEFNGEPPG
jgi:hypothetical protein